MGTLSWSQDWANPPVEVGDERDTEVPQAVGGTHSPFPGSVDAACLELCGW